MIDRSSSNRIETARWPAGVAVSPRSSSIFMITAVDDSTKPIAPITATAGGQPKAMPTPDSSAPQTSTCAMPSSATCRIDSGSWNSPRPKGPISRPALR